MNEEVANEVAVESEEDEATLNERDTADTNEEKNEISMNEDGNAEQAASHLDDSVDLLMCNGVKWSVVSEISEDSHYMPRFNAAILWSDSADVKDKTIMDFFWISFPSQMINNIKWSAEAMPTKKKAMTEVEFKKLLVVLLVLTRTSNCRQDLWSINDFMFPAPNFGTRFGISRNCFYEMLCYLRFCPESEYIDKWLPVRRLIKSCNECRAATFYPS